jgi:hypothetical protein
MPGATFDRMDARESAVSVQQRALMLSLLQEISVRQSDLQAAAAADLAT